MKDITKRLKLYLVLAVIFYVLFSLFSGELNCIEWHWAAKLIYGVGALLSGLFIFEDDNIF